MHRDRRGYLLCEKLEWREGDLLGYIRGAAISADRLVHIPALGASRWARSGSSSDNLVSS